MKSDNYEAIPYHKFRQQNVASQHDHAIKDYIFGNVDNGYLIYNTRTNNYFCFAEHRKNYFSKTVKKAQLH